MSDEDPIYLRVVYMDGDEHWETLETPDDPDAHGAVLGNTVAEWDQRINSKDHHQRPVKEVTIESDREDGAISHLVIKSGPTPKD